MANPEFSESTQLALDHLNCLKEEKKDKLKNQNGREKLDNEVESGLALLSNALQNTKNTLEISGMDIDDLAAITDPWKAWELKGGKPQPYMIGIGANGKKINYQDKIYEAKMLGNSDIARAMRQIWRQEMFEHLITNNMDALVPGGVEALLSTQKVPNQSFEKYLEPAKVLGLDIGGDKATQERMKQNTTEFTIANIAPNNPIKSISINVGHGMIDIPPEKAGELKFHHAAFNKEGTKIYALMKNGCKGNIVEINVEPKKSETKTGTPTKVSEYTEVSKYDALIGEADGLAETGDYGKALQKYQEADALSDESFTYIHESMKVMEEKITELEKTAPFYTLYGNLLTYGPQSFQINDARLKEKLDTGLFTFSSTQNKNTIEINYKGEKMVVDLGGDIQKNLTEAIQTILDKKNENWRQQLIVHRLNKSSTIEQANSIVNDAQSAPTILSDKKNILPGDLDAINNQLTKFHIVEGTAGKYLAVEKKK